jgi:DNA-binding PadR family transcriptional regulator
MNLTPTAACVLGLLQMGPAPGQPGFRQGAPMTGGQLYAAAERSISRFWNLTRSQVYAELPRLEQAGLVATVGHPGVRGAQRYRATAAGRRRFRQWMKAFVDTGPRDDQLRSPLMLAVFFGDYVEPERLAALLGEYRGQHQRGLAVANDMLAALADDASLPGSLLVRRASYCRLMIDWLDGVAARVARGRGRSDVG